MISVIIPTFNGEKTIKRALDSILAQNMEVEILICDDWSTDRTLEIVKEYPCRIIKNYNHTGGPNEGRNRGMEAAEGEYIALLDQDDWWSPNKLRHQLYMIEKYNQDLAFSMYCRDSYYFTEIDAPIYEDLKNWRNFNLWAYPGSLLIKNKNIPRFKDPMLDYQWLLELTIDRRCCRTIPMVHKGMGDNLCFEDYYRHANFHQALELATDKKVKKRIYASMGKYYYKIANFKQSRYYFRRATKTLKNLAYYVTSYLPIRKKIIEKFNVWG